MGLLDSVLGGAGSLLGGTGGAQTNVLSAVMTLLQQNGGLGNVVSQFEQSGLGAQAASWVGTGANQSISGDQLAQVFGSGAIGQIASQLGMDHGQASGALAQLLPDVINQLTPHGQITSDSGDMLSKGLSMLRGV
jgi:uncharacterized protein YidB (DUF937 family)